MGATTIASVRVVVVVFLSIIHTTPSPTAATALQLDLDPAKALQSLTVRALANDVVIGLMAATLER